MGIEESRSSFFLSVCSLQQPRWNHTRETQLYLSLFFVVFIVFSHQPRLLLSTESGKVNTSSLAVLVQPAERVSRFYFFSNVPTKMRTNRKREYDVEVTNKLNCAFSLPRDTKETNVLPFGKRLFIIIFCSVVYVEEKWGRRNLPTGWSPWLRQCDGTHFVFLDVSCWFSHLSTWGREEI